MRRFVALCAIVLAATLLDGRLPAAGLAWDFLNGLGFCALAGLVHLAWSSEAPARQPALRLHADLAIVLTLLAALHAFGLLVFDPLTFEYWQPEAPGYMLAGLGAFALIGLLTVTSLPRLRHRLYGRYAAFRRVHVLLSLAAIAAVTWHVIGAGYYASSWAERGALSLLLLALPLYAHASRRRGVAPAPERVGSRSQADRESALGASAALALSALFALLRNV